MELARVRRFSLILGAAMVVSPVAAASPKQQALEFVAGPSYPPYRCANYETLSEEVKGQHRFQSWSRTLSAGDRWCEYSGIGGPDQLPIEDVSTWHHDQSIKLPDRYFYEVSMANSEYSAQYIHNGKATKTDAAPGLESVSPSRGATRPTILGLISGDLPAVGLIEFLNRSDTEVIEFGHDDAYGTVETVRLVAIGRALKAFPNKNYRCTWSFDAKVGVCLQLRIEATNGGQLSYTYTIEHDDAPDGERIPSKLTLEISQNTSTKTTVCYIRGFTTECLLNPQEAYLTFHGFPEPQFRIKNRRVWLAWCLVGLVSLVVGSVLWRVLAQRTRTQ
ncbi:MAG: hypothetical protein ABI614_07020 [Planctomycetota bacterium]